MKTRAKFLFFLMTVAFTFGLAIFVLNAQEEKVTITGKVAPVEWDEDDNITKIAIATENEDYIVGESEIGKELFDLIDQTVEAEGMVSLTEDGEKFIIISDYTVLLDEDEENEPEESEDIK